MCATCGCGEDGVVTVTGPAHPHPHDHDHDQNHGHGHGHDHAGATRTVTLEQDVLAKNDRLAERNRDWLRAQAVTAVNLMSSPGSGKTTVLERTIRELGPELGVSVVDGDQETLADADRVRAAGCEAVQVNTGSGCHLDAEMLSDALRELAPRAGSLVFVENVGNLVCPALFDLGEHQRVVIMSTTEGEDKPLKYPHMFRTADLVLLNKIDLLPYLDFDVDRCVANVQRSSPGCAILRVSATTGDGMRYWYSWLRTLAP